MLDLEAVLQHHEIALAGRVLHFLLERGAERVEGGAARGDGCGGEEAEPAEAGEDAGLVVGGGEGGFGGDGGGEVARGGLA